MGQAQSKKLKLGLVGYYGYGNYGDELFRKVLSQNVPEANMYVIDVPRLSSDEDYFCDFERECDGVIIGGGDLIITGEWAPWYFSEHLLTKPIFIFGVGVPTWTGVNNDVVWKLSEYLSHPNVKLIAVRDIESELWVSKNLRPRRSVQVFCDMIFGLPVPQLAKPEGPPILTVITRSQPPGEINWVNIGELCDRARSYGYKIRNLVLGTGTSQAEDLKILEIDSPAIEWELIQSDSLDELTRLLAESTFIASMKFHGCVVATLFGIPSLILATTDKFNNFLRLIERPDLSSHHSFDNLADHLPRFVAPIPSHTINFLRGSALEGLFTLRKSLKHTFDKKFY